MSQSIVSTSVPDGAPAPLARLIAAGKSWGALTALHPLDLEVRRGEVLALLGPNGAGKTTALGLLTGRIAPDIGSAQLMGGDPTHWKHRRGIGVMLQQGTLPETLSVAEHVRLFSGYYPNPRPLAQTLALAGLEALAARRYERLSGGQQRRVQFALAICGNPELIFVDEPTVGLDAEARRGFWKVMRTLRDEGVAIVLTTHYLEEADALADRVVVLDQGRSIAEGSPARIKSQASGMRVRFRTKLPLHALASICDQQLAVCDDGRVEFRSASPEGVLRQLLAADPGLSALEVQPLSLEEALLALTARQSAFEAPTTAMGVAA